MSNERDILRARSTLYVTGFNPQYTTKRLLEELFIQGGPIVNITLFDTHAYVLFQHEESVPYCLALFNEVELHGQKLRLNPRYKSRDAYCYMNYLMTVRKKLMEEFMKIPAPNLPPKRLPTKAPFKRAEKQFESKKNKSKAKRNKHKKRPKIKQRR